MQPTLTVRHRLTSDTIVFECDHGITRGELENSTTNEQVEAGLAAVLQSHPCGCRPMLFVEGWASLAEGIESHGTAEPVSPNTRPPFSAASYDRLVLLKMARCPSCDPAVEWQSVAGGEGSVMIVEHAATCTIAPGSRHAVLTETDARA